MKIKILNFFAWLGIFAMSAIGTIYGFITLLRQETAQVFLDKIITKLLTVPIFNLFSLRMNIFLISFLYFGTCIIKIISFLSGEKKNYEIKTDDGIVSVSPTIVNNYIKEILKADDEIRNLKVETVKNGKKFDIKMKADLSTNTSVTDKSANLQNDIKNEVSEKIGIEVGKIELIIAKLSKKIKEEVQPKTNASDDMGKAKESSNVINLAKETSKNYFKDDIKKDDIKKEDIKKDIINSSSDNSTPEEKSENKSFFGSLFGKKEKKTAETIDTTEKDAIVGETEEVKCSSSDNNSFDNGSFDNNEDSSVAESSDDSSDVDTTEID